MNFKKDEFLDRIFILFRDCLRDRRTNCHIGEMKHDYFRGFCQLVKITQENITITAYRNLLTWSFHMEDKFIKLRYTVFRPNKMNKVKEYEWRRTMK